MLGKRIVIIDDDETIRKTFFLILSKKYRVYLAKDSEEALGRFKKAKVDLLIVDFKLPSRDGVETIAKFRQFGYKGEVILISAFPDQIDLNKIGHLSISHFFVKPLDLGALTKAVEYLLNSNNKNFEKSL